MAARITICGGVSIGSANTIASGQAAANVLGTLCVGNGIPDGTRIISALDSAAPPGATRSISIGQSASAMNQADLAFVYGGPGSANNYVSLGTYNNPQLFVTATGVSANTLSVSGNLTVANLTITGILSGSGASGSSNTSGNITANNVNASNIVTANMVGINVASPAFPIDVAGGAGVQARLIGPGGGGGALSGLGFQGYAGRGNLTGAIQQVDDGNFSAHMTLGTSLGGGGQYAPTERVRITSSGLIGINTTAPAYTLDVAGIVNHQNVASFNNQLQNQVLCLYTNDSAPNSTSTNYYGLGVNSNILRYNVPYSSTQVQYHQFFSGANLLLSLANTCQCLLGGATATSPNYYIQASGSGGASYGMDTNGIYGASMGISTSTTNVLGWCVGTGQGNFSASSAKMVLTASAQLGINTTAPAFNLDVAGNLRATSTITVQGSGSTFTCGNSITSTFGRLNALPGLYVNDGNKGIAYSGGNGNAGYFAGSKPADGIAVFGWQDGVLGTYQSGAANIALFWNSAAQVGINTTAPSYTLDVAGTLRATGNLSCGNAFSTSTIVSNAVGTPAGYSAALNNYRDTCLGFNLLAAQQTGSIRLGRLSWFGYNRSTPAAYISADTNGVYDDQGYLRFGTSYGGNGTAIDRLVLTASGQLGLGTSSPSFLFDATAGSLGAATIYAGGTGASVANIFSQTGSGGTPCIGMDNTVYGASLGISSNTSALGFCVGGGQGAFSLATAKMALTPTGLGVGTTAPAFTLDVSGNLRTTGPASVPNLIVSNTATISGILTFQAGASGAGLINWPTGSDTSGLTWGAGPSSKIVDNGDLRISTDDNMHFYTGLTSTSYGTERITISSGYVGINQTGPAYNLDTFGSMRLQNNAPTRFTMQNTQGGQGAPASVDFYTYTGNNSYDPGARVAGCDGGNYGGYLTLSTKPNGGGTGANVAEWVRVTAAGQVGIATTNPAYQLDVSGTSRTTNFINNTVSQWYYKQTTASPTTSGQLATSSSYFTLQTGGGNTNSNLFTSDTTLFSVKCGTILLPFSGVWSITWSVRFNAGTSENAMWFAPTVSATYGETSNNSNQTRLATTDTSASSLTTSFTGFFAASDALAITAYTNASNYLSTSYYPCLIVTNHYRSA